MPDPSATALRARPVDRLARFLGLLWGPFVFFLGLLALLSVSRAVLVAWQLDRVRAVDGVARVMWNGLRMDVLVLSAWSLPAVLFGLLLGGGHRLGRVWAVAVRAYLTLGAWYFLFLEVATPGFIAEYDTRPDRKFVEYLVSPREVGSMLWKGYKLELFFAALATVASVLVGWKLFGRALRSQTTLGWRRRLAFAVVLPPLLTLGVRSSLQHRPANPSTVAFSGDHMVNTLCLSSGYSLAYAVYRMRDEVDASVTYGKLPKAALLEAARAELAGVPDEAFLDPELPTLHVQEPVVETDRPLNLVIVLEESLGAQFVGELGGIGVTPELDRLASEGWWFDRLYATGTRSVRGIEAVTAGFLPTPGRAVVKLGKAQHGFFTLADLLGRQGYRTQFLYGGEAHFDNMRSFFTGNGFQEVIDQTRIEDPEFVGSWGACDGDIFRTAHQTFLANGDAPFFALIFSVSNHSPFEFPDGHIELHEQPKATVNNAVKYADAALGDFLRTARAAPYAERTLFLVVADHDARVRGADLVPIDRFHIPGVILGPGVAPRRDPRIASQIDLGPTLLSLMGIRSAHPMVGRDMNRVPGDDPGRAVMQFGPNHAHLAGDRCVILQPGLPPRQYDYRDGVLTPAATVDEAFVRHAHAIALLPSWLYDERLYRLPDEP